MEAEHIGFSVGNASGSLLLALTGARFVKTPGNKHTRRYYQQLSRLAASFATLTDMTMMMLGGELKRRERISARLGDVLSNLYLASATLKQYQDQGCPEEDLPFVQWGVEDLLAKTEQAMHEIIHNFPDTRVGVLLRVLVFPLGRHMSPPADSVTAEVAKRLMTPGASRDRLLDGCYQSQDTEDATGLVNVTLHKVIAADPLEARIAKAIHKKELQVAPGVDEVDAAVEAGVISPDDAALIRDAREARAAVIAVDDFTKEEMTPARKKRKTASAKSA